MKIKFIAAVFLAFLASGCNKSGSGETAVQTPAPETAVSRDGNYVFDGEVFTSILKNSGDPQLQSIPDEVLQKTIAGLSSFHIEIKGTEATATFGEMVVKGTLSKTSEANGEIRYLMTPVDEDKKNDTVTLVFKDDKLTLDPGKKETDKMYFKKSVS